MLTFQISDWFLNCKLKSSDFWSIIYVLTVDTLPDFGKGPYISVPTGSTQKITTYTYPLGAQSKLIASFGGGTFWCWEAPA